MKRETGRGTGITRLGAWGRLMLGVGTLAMGGCRPLGLEGISGWPGRGSQQDDSRTLDARHLALVINSVDPLSEAIGTYYQRARHIPSDQVIRVRFAAGRTTLPVAEFRRIRRQVERQTPDQVQVYALAWATPWRVGCQSITSAFSFGYRPEVCFGRCGTARVSPYYARGDVRRPWDQLLLRPSMLLAATSVAAGRALIDRGVATDGTHPPGTAYLLSTSDPLRNVRASSFPQAASGLGRLRVRLLLADSLRSASDVIAYFTGSTSVPDIASNHYRPGAVADHLTSYGGMLTGPSGTSADGGLGQMSALRWLEAGATGSYGTVVEPCNHHRQVPRSGPAAELLPPRRHLDRELLAQCGHAGSGGVHR